MKLLDVLAKEMKEWPEGMLYAVQDDDGEVKFGKHSKPILHESGIWQRSHDGVCTTIHGIELAEDWDSAIVTKDMWENAKVKNETLQSKHKHADMIALCAEFAQTMEELYEVITEAHDKAMYETLTSICDENYIIPKEIEIDEILDFIDEVYGLVEINTVH